MANTATSRELTRILTILIVVVVIAALYLAKIVLLPLALAILLAFLLSPLVSLLEKTKLPRMLAILLVLAAVFFLIALAAWSAGAQLVQIANELPHYRSNITAKVAEFHHTKDTGVSRAIDQVTRLGEEVGISPRDNRWVRPGSSPDRPLAVQEVASPTEGTLITLHGIAHRAIEALLVVVFAFFMLLEREDLRNRLIRLTGRGDLHRKTLALDEAYRRVSRYFMLLLTVNISYGAIVFLALYLIGLPHALLFGALTALLRFVPYIGAPIAALLPILLALAVFRGWQQGLEILGVFLFVEIMVANYVEPRLYGKHTGVSPLAILVAAVFWALIWGPVGLLLSVPLTVCMVVMGSHVPSLEFLNVLLGGEPVVLASAHYYQRLRAGDARGASEVLDVYLTDKPLEDMYDSVLIPALALAEQDRYDGKIDIATAGFIYRVTHEMVEEFGSREQRRRTASTSFRLIPPELETAKSSSGLDSSMEAPLDAQEILCIPARDEADEIAAAMLAQLLTYAGHRARFVSTQRVEAVVKEITDAVPDTIVLSALSPFAVADTRKMYKTLRSRRPHGRMLLGLWNCPEDEQRAAQEISQGEQERIYITLSGAAAEAGRISNSLRLAARENEPGLFLTQA